jgi:hypothetical protein
MIESVSFKVVLLVELAVVLLILLLLVEGLDPSSILTIICLDADPYPVSDALYVKY